MDGITPQSKTHTWIIVLLVWAIMLLMFGIGYMVYMKTQSQNTLSEADLANACTNAVNAAVAAIATNDEAATCETPEDRETYADTLAHPLTFDFPDTWNVYTMQDGTTDTTTVSLSAETFGDCTACGGYSAPVPITVTLEKSSVPDPAIWAELEANPNADVTKTETFRGGTLVTWTDTSSEGAGIKPGTHIEWIAVKNSTVITASYYKASGGAEEDAAWNMILATIDVNAF